MVSRGDIAHFALWLLTHYPPGCAWPTERDTGGPFYVFFDNRG
jgi:hypothetical protein